MMIALHLMLEFKPESFMEDAPSFFDQLRQYCVPNRLEAKSWGNSRAQWITMMSVDELSLTEEDKQKMIDWLGKQSAVMSFQCQLAPLHAEPFLDPAIFNIPPPKVPWHLKRKL